MFQDILDKIISVKFFIIVLSTVLFYIGKLDESGWIMMVLTTTGIRAVNDMAVLYASTKAPAKAEEPK